MHGTERSKLETEKDAVSRVVAAESARAWEENVSLCPTAWPKVTRQLIVRIYLLPPSVTKPGGEDAYRIELHR